MFPAANVENVLIRVTGENADKSPDENFFPHAHEGIPFKAGKFNAGKNYIATVKNSLSDNFLPDEISELVPVTTKRRRRSDRKKKGVKKRNSSIN